MKPLASTPPMGWNSFDSYCVEISEPACFENLKVFVERFKPLGYEYFVIDAGWYIEYRLMPGSLIPVTGDDRIIDYNINEFGYYIPSKTYFKNGLKPLADECHKHGVKFGLHIMRGIPRKSHELNTPVKGTPYCARDIADTSSICDWSPLNYGIDMSKNGSQEYYDGFIRQLADYGVDFIKADDIVEFPDEIEAVVKAIKKTGRPIVLSLSPGDRVSGNSVGTYEKADMLRVTGDVWDRQPDIDKCFDSWLSWQYVSVRDGFWLDMDMIPFGELRVTKPKDSPQNQISHEGCHRMDCFSPAQKKTFITMRAMSASPLFMGGVLSTLDDDSLRLLTNREMIACNQNGVMGRLIENRHYVQIWRVEEKNTDGNAGWIGIFNRLDEVNKVETSLKSFGSKPGAYEMLDVWGNRPYATGPMELGPHECVFIRYVRKS